MAIGLAVRAGRRSSLLDQSDLAELAGVSERTLRDIERGRGNPGIAAVLAVLHVLGQHLEVRG
ncbi:helix-turn-helix domain-containing protein [Herbiconiux sp. P18]|uniref:helix-turn-helix domain-containing protein n=1 Tax=Herbiconiux liangxiaofengii TaxID=3342795 RepID=UPI0035BB454F